MGIELAGQSIHNRTSQLIQILCFNTGTNFLYQGNICLVDVDDKVLILVREQVLDDIISGNIRFIGNLNQHAHTVHVGIKTQLPCLQINITGQNVVENDVLDKIIPVIFFIIIMTYIICCNNNGITTIL